MLFRIKTRIICQVELESGKKWLFLRCNESIIYYNWLFLF